MLSFLEEGGSDRKYEKKNVLVTFVKTNFLPKVLNQGYQSSRPVLQPIYSGHTYKRPACTVTTEYKLESKSFNCFRF